MGNSFMSSESKMDKIKKDRKLSEQEIADYDKDFNIKLNKILYDSIYNKCKRPYARFIVNNVSNTMNFTVTVEDMFGNEIEMLISEDYFTAILKRVFKNLTEKEKIKCTCQIVKLNHMQIVINVTQV